MELIELKTVDSTNKYAKEHIDVISDKTVVVADNQTAGRGRFNRKWQDNGSENVYASIVLKPSDKMLGVYSNLTQYLALILTEVFEEYGVNSSIKWPNDILVNGKKISGILAESVMRKGCLEGIVLGFGVNLNCDKCELEKIDQPATSLNLETGMWIDKKNFLKRLLEKFFLRYDVFIQKGFLLISDGYKKKITFLNSNLKVKVLDRYVEGTAIDITENGALKIVDSIGKEQILYMGDIL